MSDATTEQTATIEQKPAEQTATEQKPAEQTTTEQKPADQKPAEQTTEQKPAEQKPAESKAPEAYTDFKVLDGVQLDSEIMGEFGTVAKELGLTQEQAQKLVDLGAKSSLKGVDSIKAALTKQVSDWSAASKADAEIGGEKFDENLAAANRALGKFAKPGFIKFLADSGLSQHPEMIRTWRAIDKATSGDSIQTGRQGGGDDSGLVGFYDHPTSRA
jgi:hypothetical protein